LLLENLLIHYQNKKGHKILIVLTASPEELITRDHGRENQAGEPPEGVGEGGRSSQLA
jgi:hypothetical protein